MKISWIFLFVCIFLIAGCSTHIETETIEDQIVPLLEEVDKYHVIEEILTLSVGDEINTSWGSLKLNEINEKGPQLFIFRGVDRLGLRIMPHVTDTLVFAGVRVRLLNMSDDKATFSVRDYKSNLKPKLEGIPEVNETHVTQVTTGSAVNIIPELDIENGERFFWQGESKVIEGRKITLEDVKDKTVLILIDGKSYEIEKEKVIDDLNIEVLSISTSEYVEERNAMIKFTLK